MKPARIQNLLIALLLCVQMQTPALAQQQTRITRIDPPKSVLFAGNSLTFYNNAIYTHLRKLLVAENPDLRKSVFLKSMTISGALLSDHKGGLEQMLKSRSWDVVVLQGHSREPYDPDMAPGFAETARAFSSKIRSVGATPVLFMTWANLGRPEMTEDLENALVHLGGELEVMVVPVGLAFERAYRDIPGVMLHNEDRVHPSLEGTYLAAAVFYAALYGKSPEKLGYDAGLDEDLARRLRLIAWQITEENHQKS